jgi:hypothetical protein
MAFCTVARWLGSWKRVEHFCGSVQTLPIMILMACGMVMASGSSQDRLMAWSSSV